MPNAINWDVLPELTADDLKEIGVAAVGDRRRLLSGIATLRGSAVPVGPALPADVSDAAERRHLTVMFCDLVGSTAVSTRLDPGNCVRKIRGYQNACSGVVARYDGFVAKFMGDGVLAYFGQLVIAGATRRLVGDLFRLTDLGRQTAKGFAQPVEAFAVEGIAVTESRFEAARRGITDLVGRAAENALLRDRLREAWAGTGQIVLLSGEPALASRTRLRLALPVSAPLRRENFCAKFWANLTYRGCCVARR